MQIGNNSRPNFCTISVCLHWPAVQTGLQGPPFRVVCTGLQCKHGKTNPTSIYTFLASLHWLAVQTGSKGLKSSQSGNFGTFLGHLHWLAVQIGNYSRPNFCTISACLHWPAVQTGLQGPPFRVVCTGLQCKQRKINPTNIYTFLASLHWLAVQTGSKGSKFLNLKTLGPFWVVCTGSQCKLAIPAVQTLTRFRLPGLKGPPFWVVCTGLQC